MLPLFFLFLPRLRFACIVTVLCELTALCDVAQGVVEGTDCDGSGTVLTVSPGPDDGPTDAAGLVTPVVGDTDVVGQGTPRQLGDGTAIS